jgi:peptidoglycan/xylan/chitin deacetylase (PgdA/CDA1 family)
VKNPLFLIANHGFRHKSCSVNGKTAYGIKGTSSVEEVWEEVEKGARAVEALTGKRPRFYRSGTNYYDEIAVKIVYDLGMKPVGYSILGDGGATFSSERVMEAVIKARPGDIIICHMNHPEGETAEGLKEAVPILLERGYTFIRLDEAIN